MARLNTAGPVLGRRAFCGLAGLAALAGARRAALAQDQRFFRLATGGVSGTYFAIGSALATALSSPIGLPCRGDETCGVPGLNAAAQSTAGSVANAAALAAGGVESAFVQADVAFHAWEGSGPFASRPPVKELRTLASLYPETLHLVVRGDSQIAAVGDLRGKRVALDEPGSGTLVDAQLVLRAFGLKEGDLEPVYVRGGVALKAIRERTLDAFFILAGEPVPVVSEAVADLGCRLVPVDGGPVEEMLHSMPFMTRRAIAAGTYGDLPAVDTIAVGADWLTTAALDDTLAYDLVRVLFAKSTLERLAAAHPLGSRITLATALVGVAVPLHAGAERFYRERGVLHGE